MKPPVYCYLIRCANNAFYTGWTTNINRRYKQHKLGTGARYTRMNSPLELVYWETQPDKKSAIKRELQLKKLSHQKKLELTSGWNNNLEIDDPFQSFEYIVTTPGRVNLLGEHIDYNGGPVLPVAINRYMKIGANIQENNIVTLEALDLNEQITFSFENITAKIDLTGKPLPKWALYPAGVLWAAREMGFDIQGFNAVFSSNIPIGSGLSSSAAVEVGFAALLRELCDWKIDNLDLSELCLLAENKYVGVNCGIMDQFACANGNENEVLYLDTKDLTFESVLLPESVSIIIADSKKRRSLSNSEYNDRRNSCEEAVAILRKVLPEINYLCDVSIDQLKEYGNLLPDRTFKRAKHVIEECNRVNNALNFLKNNDIVNFGILMNEGHQSLRDLYQVSIPELDFLVNTATGIEGCYGSRLTGAGFGGCTVSLVENNHSENFIRQLKNEYYQVYGIQADIYVCKASNGVAVEWRKKSKNNIIIT